MKFERIIFISQDRLTKRNADRYGIQLLIDRGFQVEFWECTPFLMPALFETYSPPDAFTFAGFKLFRSEQSLLKTIDELTSHDVVFTALGGCHIKTRRIYKRISEKNAPWGSFISGRIPVPVELKGFWNRIEKFCESPSLLINFIFKKFPSRWFKLRAFKYVLVSGAAPISSYFTGLIDSQTDILDAHSMEYDLYFENRKFGISDKPEHIVFLDAFGPFHPDHLVFKTQFPCSTEDYYGNLNSIFKTIEKKFGLNVIIAAHPKSKYEEMPDLFEGRQVIRGETHDLVKNSKFVLTSASTSVHFAVIYKKPIIFLAMNPSKTNQLDLKINHVASMFGKVPIHWPENCSVDFEKEIEIDEEKYSQFLNNYIKKSGSPDRHSWDIFADYLESL
jgi:hypothetical protein